MTDCRMYIGDHRLDQSDFGMHRREIQESLASMTHRSPDGGQQQRATRQCLTPGRRVGHTHVSGRGLAHPKTRLEAITSRPKLLSAVGRMTSHGGQKKILLTITHEAAAQIKRLVANVHAGLSHVMQTAAQLDKPQRWFALVRYIVARILSSQAKPNLGLTAIASG